MPHLSAHQREVAEKLARGLGKQALTSLLALPADQPVVQLEKFEAFVLGQRQAASEANAQAVKESVRKTQDELLHQQARIEVLNKTGLLRRGPSEWILPSLMGRMPAPLSTVC